VTAGLNKNMKHLLYLYERLLCAGCVHNTNMQYHFIQKLHMEGACVFSCNLPPALLAQ